MIALVIFSLFCALALGAPDSWLLAAGALTIPFAGTAVSYQTFLFVGPLILIALAANLHVYVGHLHRLSDISASQKIPTLFNVPSKAANLLAVAIFYWLAPLVLFLFVAKSLPLPISPIIALIALAASGWLAWLQATRSEIKVLKRVLFSFSLLTATLVIVDGWYAYSVITDSQQRSSWYSKVVTRKLNLYRANLANQDLSGFNLRSANLRGANLRSADLRNTNLEAANLIEADLEEANLDFSNLASAKLIGAKFIRARLTGSDLSKVNANSANFQFAILLGTEFRGADLEMANLDGANLGCVRIKSLIDGRTRETCADLRDVIGLDCKALTKADKWEEAQRDARLSCLAPIPQ